MIKNKIGIVIVSYNASDVVNMTLSSVRKSKNNTSYKLILIDNASNPVELKKIQLSFDICSEKDQNWTLLSLENNLGFSGGNNVGIKSFLDDDEISHICLLNSDVIVSDYWIDRLLEKNKDIISCVTNKADSEQCVPCNYDFSKEECLSDDNHLVQNVFDTVNNYSQQWYNAWENNIVEAEPTYFCVVMKKEVFQKVGLLDETFFPGGFEDDDYCIRSKHLGYISYLARDVFMHHWGSASFGQLQHQFFSERAKKNKSYLEEKHNIVCKRRPERPFVSFFQDLIFNNTDFKEEQNFYLELYIKSLDGLIKHYTSEYKNLKNSLINSNKKIPNNLTELFSKVESLDALVEWKKIITSYKSLDNLQDYEKDLALNIHRIVECNFIMHDILTKVDLDDDTRTNISIENKQSKFKKLFKVIKLFFKLKGVVFFAGYPYPERENDGYFQRIKAIDSLFTDRWRIYIEDATNSSDNKLYDRPAHNTIVIRVSGSKKRQIFIKIITFFIVLRCRSIYYHSVLRMQDNHNWIFMYMPSFVKKVIDIHGVVPEEFRYHDDFYSAVLYEGHEKLATKKANLVITVTDSMKKYFIQKYRESISGDFITLPIFPSFSIQNSNKHYNDQKPIVVYAGGLHKWQQTSKMIDTISKTLDLYTYKYYCPSPDIIKKMMLDKNISITNITIESKNQTELFGLYKECHFGLVLREDIVVNHVACPTKLIEYIAMGIIPILDTVHIGDFYELGLQFVSLDDFIAGVIPTEEERNKMVAENNHIVEKLKTMRYEGSNQLYDLLTEESKFSSRKLKNWAKRIFPENSSFGMMIRKVWHKIKTKQNHNIKEIIVDEELKKKPSKHYDIVVQVENFLAGGLENVVLDLNKTLIDKGYSVLLLVLGESGKAVDKAKNMGIDVYVTSYNETMYIELIKEVSPKLILCHYSWKGLHLASNKKVPVIQVIHNVYMWFDEVEKNNFKSSSDYTTAFIAVSDYAKNYTTKRLGIADEKCFTIPNGVKIDKFLNSINDELLLSIKNELNLIDDDFIFLNVGSINHQKNQLSLVKAFKEITESCPNAKLILLGPIYESNLFDQIDGFIQENNLSNKIIYAGSSNTPEVYYKLANAYVHSANFEGGQLSLIEYLLGNKPIISTNIGFCQHIENLEGIVIVSPHVDIVDYYGKIWEIPSSEETIKELTQAMIKVYHNYKKPELSLDIIESMDCSKTYQLYVKVIEKIINSKKLELDDFKDTWTKKIELLSKGNV